MTVGKPRIAARGVLSPRTHWPHELVPGRHPLRIASRYGGRKIGKHPGHPVHGDLTCVPLRALARNGSVEILRGGARAAAIRAARGDMRRAGHDPDELEQRSFWLDVHIAHLCRARGVVLWTDDGDHKRVEPYVPHRPETLPAWPS